MQALRRPPQGLPGPNTSDEGVNGREDTPAPQILTYYTPEGTAYNAGSARPTTAVQLTLT